MITFSNFNFLIPFKYRLFYKFVSLAILIGIFYIEGCLATEDIFWFDIGRGIFAFDKENVRGRCYYIIREDFGVFIKVPFAFVDTKLFSINDVILALRLGFW